MGYVRIDANRIVAHLPGVQVAVAEEAEKLGLKADALFSQHNRPGGHEIEVTHGKVDSEVSLVGPAPLSVEFGHFAGKRGTVERQFVDGLHILERAADL